MKNVKVSGFTLVETIIVSVILVILASVAVPGVINYVSDAENRECEGIIKQLEATAEAESKITLTLKTSVQTSPSCIFDCIEGGHELEQSCPSGGTYTAYYDDTNDKICFRCSVHNP